MQESEKRQTAEPSAGRADETLATATEHVGEAHRLLTRLREKVDDHPDLDRAIERLELALADLNLRTGGML
jgi:hypothetical protein